MTPVGKAAKTTPVKDTDSSSKSNEGLRKSTPQIEDSSARSSTWAATSERSLAEPSLHDSAFLADHLSSGIFVCLDSDLEGVRNSKGGQGSQMNGNLGLPTSLPTTPSCSDGKHSLE